MNKKEKLLGFLTGQAKVPYLLEEIAALLGAENQTDELYTLLNELIAEGKVIKSKKGRYESAQKQGLFVGVYRHNPNGYGFVSGDEEDFFIPPEKNGGAFSGDTVQIIILPSKRHKNEAEVVAVLKRENASVIGIYRGGTVYPSNKNLDMQIRITNAHKSFESCRVVVKINDFDSLTGEVVVSLGLEQEPESELLAIVHEYSIPTEFPARVLEQADKAAARAVNSENRRDLRALLTITIDGADARDLDDAISLELSPEGEYILYVHIADVSEYVQKGSLIDKEAYARGTSCYFPDRVYPMLPPQLSNDACSLHPKVDRLALTTKMTVRKDGTVAAYEVFESVICSDYRMVYEDVNTLLENGSDPLWEKYEPLRDMLAGMEKLSRRLRKHRFDKGSIDFNIPETKIILNDEGRVTDICARRQTTSNKIIEEFMLACNKTLAEHAFWAQLPFVYRVHAEPDAEKIEEFKSFISLFDRKIPGRVTGKRLMEVLDSLKGAPGEKAVNTVLLRSMAKAKYESENLGHFGIGAAYYCHFTSPIRRYPDLVCHRTIKEAINGRSTDGFAAFVQSAAQISSQREEAAEQAEREAVRVKICEYMEQNVGEEYEAEISSVTSFGFFAQLDNTAEGLVRAEDIEDDYYVFDAKTLTLTGERSKKTFRIGDRVKVTVSRVDREARYIDFFLAGKGRHQKGVK